MSALTELRVADMTTFLAVRRARSITKAARALGVTPSQVSKAITRLERALGVALLVRNTRGVGVSEAGTAIAPRMEAAIEQLHALRGEADGVATLTIAAPTYLHPFFVPLLANALPDHRLRCVSMPPAIVRAYASERLFDVAFSIGDASFHPTWVCNEVGPLRRGLFASPALARRLGPAPIAEAALKPHPFISPIYVLNGATTPVDDECPLSRGARTLGTEVETIGLGLELAAQTEQLVFGPVVAAASHVSAGRLVELDVEAWTPSARTIYLHAHGDVRQRVLRAILQTCRAALAGLGG